MVENILSQLQNCTNTVSKTRLTGSKNIIFMKKIVEKTLKKIWAKTGDCNK